MAISIRGSGGTYAVASTTQTIEVVLPTHAAGDMLLVRVASKAATGQAPSACNLTIGTQGWAAIGTQYQNGTTVNGNGVGSLAFQCFYKIATSGAETNPVVDFGLTPSPGMAVAIVYQHGAGESFITPVGAGGGDATLRTSQTCTISSHISVTAGDMVDFFLGWGDNYASTSPTITQTGVTFGVVAEEPATALSTGDGFDGAMDGGYRLATAGTSSAAAVVTATFGNSEQGGAWQTRLRVQTSTSASAGVATSTGAAATGSDKIEARGTGLPAGTGAALVATGRPGEYATSTLATATGAALDGSATTEAGEITFDAGLAVAIAAAEAAHGNLVATLGYARGRSS